MNEAGTIQIKANGPKPNWNAFDGPGQRGRFELCLPAARINLQRPAHDERAHVEATE